MTSEGRQPSAARYRLVVHRELSSGSRYWDPEPIDFLPEVSAAAFRVLASRSHPDEPMRAVWRGGPDDDVLRAWGRGLINSSGDVRDAATELRPLLEWTREHTQLGDVCELVEVPQR